MDWFRSIHGAPTHRKWLSVARKAGQPVPVVVATVWALMDHASRHIDRGSLAGFDADDQAAFLGVDEEDVTAVMSALEEKGWIADGRIASWSEHQSKREDGSAERAKAWRERQKTQEDDQERDRTQPNALERPDTDLDTERKTLSLRATGKSPRQRGMSEAERQIETDFEKFWQTYPHKVGKGQARKAYRTALRKVDSPDALRVAAERFAESSLAMGREAKFIAHPATWLNGERWLDEPVERPPDSPETDRPRAGGNPPWAKWRAHLTFTQQIDTLKEFKQFQEAHGFDAANQRAIVDAKQAGVPL